MDKPLKDLGDGGCGYSDMGGNALTVWGSTYQMDNIWEGTHRQKNSSFTY